MSTTMYIIYKTTNLVNKKFYIGVHCGNNESYLGSGVALKQAIQKYGRDNFKRETLFSFNTMIEAYEKESELVTQELVDMNECYNLCLGGQGGFPTTPQIKEKMSQAKLGKPNVQKGKKLSSEHKQKLSVARKKRVISEETRKRLSETMKRKHAEKKAF